MKLTADEEAALKSLVTDETGGLALLELFDGDACKAVDVMDALIAKGLVKVGRPPTMNGVAQ